MRRIVLHPQAIDGAAANMRFHVETAQTEELAWQIVNAEGGGGAEYRHKLRALAVELIEQCDREDGQ